MTTSLARFRCGLFVAALALLAALAPAIALASSQPATPKPDFSEWQALLTRYCILLPGKAPLQDTRFDYEQLYVDERIWTLKRSERLERVRAQLLSTRPSELAPKDRLAWALNTYNFLVVEQVTLRLLVPGRKFLRIKSPNDIRILTRPLYDAPVIDVDGRSLSIEEFGRRYVYGDTASLPGPRSTPADPRWSFAMCRGYLGSPPLAPRAFRADSLEAQLDLAASRALAQPRFVSADPRSGSVTASNFFSDERIDYGNDPNRALPFIEKFGTKEVKQAIRKFKLGEVSRFSQFDSRLNQFERPKQKPPEGAVGAEPGH